MERKQLLGAAIFGALMGALPWLLQAAGILPGVRTTAWVAIFFLFLLSVVKVAYAPSLSSDGFTFAKQGNDFCLLTLSGVVTAFATQSATDADLLPGARRLLQDLPVTFGQAPVVQNIIGLVWVGILALGGFLFSAYQIRKIREDKTSRWKEVRALVCFTFGVVCLSAHIIILISK